MFQKYIGIEFEERGRGPDCFDCYGLAREIYREQLNILLPTYSDYSSTQDTIVINEIINQNHDKHFIEVFNPKQFDIILLRVRGFPTHIGVMIDPKSFIHIEQGINSCIESINSNMWKRRVVGFYRYRKEA